MIQLFKENTEYTLIIQLRLYHYTLHYITPSLNMLMININESS